MIYINVLKYKQFMIVQTYPYTFTVLLFFFVQDIFLSESELTELSNFSEWFCWCFIL
jgi:hypothetical protein